MKIRRATKGNQLNQGFGAANTIPSVLPIYIALGHLGHEGWDWGVHCEDYTVPHGGKCDPVYCDLNIPAKITSIQKSEDFGFGIVAVTEDADGIFEHLWWHFDTISPNLLPGDIITPGQELGISGNTGRASGDHLHRELRVVSKDSYGNYYKSFPNNGYGGAIDPTPYFVNEFVLDYVSKPKLRFDIDMEYGQTSPEVVKLQQALNRIGATLPETGYYGALTRLEVGKFQRRYGVWNPLIFWYDQSKYVGPKTRVKLNEIYG